MSNLITRRSALALLGATICSSSILPAAAFGQEADNRYIITDSTTLADLLLEFDPELFESLPDSVKLHLSSTIYNQIDDNMSCSADGTSLSSSEDILATSDNQRAAIIAGHLVCNVYSSSSNYVIYSSIYYSYLWNCRTLSILFIVDDDTGQFIVSDETGGNDTETLFMSGQSDRQPDNRSFTFTNTAYCFPDNPSTVVSPTIHRGTVRT